MSLHGTDGHFSLPFLLITGPQGVHAQTANYNLKFNTQRQQKAKHNNA
jgi:hypothetical protein